MEISENPDEMVLTKKKDGIFDEGFLVIIVGLGNVFNFYFHIYMSRNLGPEGYSTLNSLMSLLFVLSVPIITVQTTITKFVAEYTARQEPAKVRRLFLECLKRVSIGAFVLTSLIILGAPLIGGFLNIEKNTPIVVSGVLVFAMFMMPVFWAVLQGREQFGLLGASYFVNFTAKCGFGILFFILGFGVGGVLLGVVLSFVAAFFVCFRPMGEILAAVPDDDIFDMHEIYKFAAPVVVALFFLSFFCNLDIALVRHFFGHSEDGLKLAGYYATASIIGKCFLFLPLGIVLALIPKVARKKAMGDNPIPILMRALGLDIVLSAIGILGCFVLARHLALFLAKTDAPELISLIKMFGIAITPVAATTVLVNYNLANERYGFIWTLVPLTILTFTGVWVFHKTPMTVLLIIGGGGLALLFSLLVFTIISRRNDRVHSESEPSVDVSA